MSKKDAAIQKEDVVSEEENLQEQLEDFEEEDTKDEEASPKSPREAAIEAIVEQEKQQRAEDVEDGEEDKEETDEEDTEEAVLTAKVDGSEEELTTKELDEKLRAYQKYASADKRLEEAALRQKEIDKREQELADREAKLKEEAKKEEVQDIKDAVDAATQDENIDFNAEEFATKIREGEDAEAVEAINALFKSLKQPTPAITTEQISTLVQDGIQELRKKEEQERAEKEIEEANAQAIKAEEVYREEFKDFLEEHDSFYDLTVMEATKLNADEEWANKSFEDKFREAGNRAKRWVAPKGAHEEREERKKNKKKASTPSVKASTPKDEKPQTESEIIADIKKARGQLL